MREVMEDSNEEGAASVVSNFRPLIRQINFSKPTGCQ